MSLFERQGEFAGWALPPLHKAELLAVYERYVCAELGELNTTAEALEAACLRFGWPAGGVDTRGYLAWARAMLLTEK